MSEEKKILSEEELKQVAGGDTKQADGYTFYGFVGKYDAVVGNWYWVFDDSNHHWFSGTLLKSWEKDYGCYTKRTHKFSVGIGKYWTRYQTVGDVVEVCGDDVTLCEHCIYPDGSIG